MCCASNAPNARARAASAPLFSAPLLFGFPLHGRMLWVLALNPVWGPPGAVGRAEPLRHDAFEAKLTSMAKHHVTRIHDVVVNLQPNRRSGEQPNQQHLAALDALAPQVIAVELDQIKGVKEDVFVVTAIAQSVEARHAIAVTGHGLAIDQA